MLGLQEGDRIGHGLALGMEPGLWASRTGRAALPRQDRVFDLAWEWSWWTRRGGGADAARLAYIEREVSDVASAWFGTTVDIADIERLRALSPTRTCWRRRASPIGLLDTRHAISGPVCCSAICAAAAPSEQGG